jgi:chemotaxis protein MotB
MKLKYFLFAGLVGVMLQSCVVLSNKKYKSILAAQDSLITRTGTLEAEVAKLQSDTARLHREIAGLKGNLADVQTQYNTLNDNYAKLNTNFNSSSSKVSQLSADLQKREARLKEVEDILRKRDEASNALKNKLQKALLGFQQNGLTVDMRNGKVYVSLTDKLLFPSGSIVIDERGKSALKQLAAVLNKEPDINIAVEGHTDNKPWPD